MGLMDLFQQGDIREKIYAAANKNPVPQGGATGAAFHALFPQGLGNLAFGRNPEPIPALNSPEGTQYMADLASNMMVPGTFIGPKGMSNLLGDDVARGLMSGAEAKLAQGVPREEVFRELGVFKGPEGKWRYEIDDSGAKFRPEGLRDFHNESSLVRQHRMMDHDELAKAYPDSGLIAYRKHGKSGAAYHDDSDTIFLPQDAGNPNMFPDLRENMRSMTHHELQHAVQGREGFAAGGSPERMADEVGGARLRVNELRSKMDIAKNVISDEARWIVADPSKREFVKEATRKWQEKLGKLSEDNPFGVDEKMAVAFEMQESDDILRRWIAEYNENFNLSRSDPYDLYKRLAGEAESRAVQDRMNMNMEQRRASFPEYATRNDLIVHGLMSGGN
jgi:hypothetical protein